MENAPLFAFLDGFAADLRATSPFGAGVDPLPAYLILVLLVLVALIIALIRRGARLKRAEAGLAEMEGLRRQMAVGEARAERLPLLEQALTEAREERDGLLGALNQAEAKLETVERSHTARLEELRGLNEALKGKFKTLANEVLEGNSKAFLDRVTERFATHSETAKAELDARQKAIDGMVKPLSEKLGAFDTILREMEKHRTDAYGAIREQVEHLKLGQAQLSGETRKLVQALRAPKTRGRWGEMQLRQVFELSGMAEHVDFETETSHRTEGGLQRPDAIVRMPGGRSLVIDAKTSLDGYLDALEADTPEARDLAITRHARHVADHVRLLSSKKYHDLLAYTPRFRGDVHSGRCVSLCRRGKRPRAFGTRHAIACGDCHPFDHHRAAQDYRLWLAARGDCRERRHHPPRGKRALWSARRFRRQPAKGGCGAEPLGRQLQQGDGLARGARATLGPQA